MAIGKGGIDYGKADKKKRKQIQENESRIRQDYDYVQSEIDRAQNVIKERQERGLDTSAQDKYLGKLKGQLDSNPQFMRRSYEDKTKERVQSEVENEIEKRKRSIANDMQEQRQANRSAIEGNKQYLNEQIENYQQQQGQANREATQLQNRRGGFYSGGLDYQRGQIARATTNAIEDTSREVAQRNASLREQNAMISRQASEAIRELENQAPGLVRSRVMDAMQRWDQKQMQEAQLTGTYMGNPTVQAQQNEFNNALRQAQITGQYQGNPTFQAQQQQEQLQREREQLMYQRALQRLQTFGSVQTEEDAEILGIPVGTPTYAVRQDQLARAQARASGGSSGGSYGGSSGGGYSGSSTSPSSAWAQLDPLDQNRYVDMYQNGTNETKQWLQSQFPEAFGQGGGTQAEQVGINQRDFQVFEQEFGDLTSATPQEIHQFVNRFYAQGTIDEQQAEVVENYLNNRANALKQQQEQQQIQQERQERQERQQRQEQVRPNAIYDPSNFGKGL